MGMIEVLDRGLSLHNSKDSPCWNGAVCGTDSVCQEEECVYEVGERWVRWSRGWEMTGGGGGRIGGVRVGKRVELGFCGGAGARIDGCCRGLLV